MDDYTDAAATFGDRLVYAREQQGLSQQQLARRLGLKLATIQNWENDRSEPRANKVQMLAGFLNVSIVWLLTGQGEGSPAALSGAEAGPTPSAQALLEELKSIRLQHGQLVTRLGKLEKSLREMHKVQEGAG